MIRTQLITALALLVGTAPAARADENEWSRGVSKADQDRAFEIYESGNQLYAEQRYASALDKYREALAVWDHPQIELNAAATLVRLERDLEAAEAIDHALRFGAKPFDDAAYQTAVGYQLLLKKRVGTINATCNHPGAKVTLDGKPWFECGAKPASIRVVAGTHSIVAGGAEGYETQQFELVVDGGTTKQQAIVLRTLEESVVLVYPFQRWLPRTVMGAGAAIALGGLGVYLSGRSQMDDFETNFASACATGCPADLDRPDLLALRDQRDGARFKGSIGLTMIIAGGAATVAGVVLTIMNRPKRVLPTLERPPEGNGLTVGAVINF
jgi:hypothetical protein